MISGSERARTRMDTTRDNRHRIAAAAQADRCFDTYEIQMDPEEALSFAATAPEVPEIAQYVYVLIDVINHEIPPAEFGPSHPRTGTPRHVFRVGRDHGDRIVSLELFKGYFGPDYPFDELKEKLREYGRRANCALSEEGDDYLFVITFRWAIEKGDR